jgi:hypothetical protein
VKRQVEFKFFSKDMLLSTVLERWNTQMADSNFPHLKEITEKLTNLKPPFKKNVIDRIIGNTSWTSFDETCIYCQDSLNETVIVTTKGGTQYICVNCAISIYNSIPNHNIII